VPQRAFRPRITEGCTNEIFDSRDTHAFRSLEPRGYHHDDRKLRRWRFERDFLSDTLMPPNTVTVTTALDATSFNSKTSYDEPSGAPLQSTVTASLTAYTLGPVRSGLLFPILAPTILTHTIMPSYAATVGAYCFGTGVSCVLSPPVSVPFTLGTSFTFSAFYHSETTPIVVSTMTADIWNFSYKLTEADGITPVTAFETPEPGSLSLLGTAVAGLVLLASVTACRPKT
jgi:hypothetical protein